MENESENASAPISLPKGGGAIQGIGETFQPNLFTGTGNFSVPIFTSPGRNGSEPQLTLPYSTGNGNSPFGLGWKLSIPRITRKTEKGLPQYRDEDVFVMSGAEDLVPYLEQASDDPEQWHEVVSQHGDYRIQLYRPRTEGQFARIEKWTYLPSSPSPLDSTPYGDVHWRATTKENITSIYGKTPAARIANPEHADRVFEWLLEETFDARGNHIAYEYIQEDSDLELPGIHEHNRGYTQAYIRRILYGNTPENLDPNLRVGPTRTGTDHTNHLGIRERHYVFEVLFDYSDLPEDLAIPHELGHDIESTIPNDWPAREDPFSSFRAGFEIRTLRRCARVLMLHHFNEGELIGAPLVKSTDFGYSINPDTQLSMLTSVTVRGYRKDPNNPQQYLVGDLPPVTFKYSAFEPQNQRYESVTAAGQDFPPRSLGAPDFALMDIFGNALPDVVQSTGAGFHFWENLGEGGIDRRHPQHGDQPVVSLGQANVSVGDMGGDGLADLVVEAAPLSGFYESTPDGRWTTFKPFEVMPSFNLGDPNTRLLDLTGDGLSDALVTRDAHFLWYRCRGEAGYDDPQEIPRQYDLESFPDVYFDDPAGRVRLADMTGDGLNDIVLIHDGRIDYWPNMGYGKFGRRITMANAPRIGYTFDPSRVFLVDLDATGPADLVYVDHNQVLFWFNQSGNAWSDQQTVQGTPYVTDLTSVQFTDFYGTGTATLLWSYDYGQQPGGANYKVLDFCGGQKPNLLIEMDNKLGATTRVKYAPSTKFYLEDRANGMPWSTSLPFPVQVVEKVEAIDRISKTKLVTTYKYHHGCFDGREREFCGFGRVDEFSTEIFDDFTLSSLHQDAEFTNNQYSFHAPPQETRTWFHTGIYFDADRYLDHRELTEQYGDEYYQGDAQAFTLGRHLFEQADGSLGTGDVPNEAFRALRGAELRHEVYGRDDSDIANHPYIVKESCYSVKALQPRSGNDHAVYLTTPKESITYDYERDPSDPRIAHVITLGMDEYGNVTDDVIIAYPRRAVPTNLPEQSECHVVYTRTDFINEYSEQTATAPAFHYAGVECQRRSYELTGLGWHAGDSHFGGQVFADVRDNSIDVDPNSFKPFDWQRRATDSGILRRIIDWRRAYFRTNDDPNGIDPVGNLDHRLPLGEIASLGLPYESYKAAFSNSTLWNIYGERTADIELAAEGGYHPHPNHDTAEGDGSVQEYWWVPSGRQSFKEDAFFHADRSQSQFGAVASSEFDNYGLLVKSAKDALPAPTTNVYSARNDYRVLQPYEVTDPNGNRRQVAFNALGLVVGTALMGKEGENIGDSLAGFEADLTEDQINAFIAAPRGPIATELLQGATSRIIYDLKRSEVSNKDAPVYVATVARETHGSEPAPPDGLRLQVNIAYSDGFGRVIQSKTQAEPGPVHAGGDEINPRWVGSGWTLFNNKGNPVRQYEPFFSASHDFEFDQAMGVSPILFYDPIGRVRATLHPNHSWEKVVFSPWRQETWDVNDTALVVDPKTDNDVGVFFQRIPGADYLPTWREERVSGALGLHEQVAANKTAVHANTPKTAYVDSLGRIFLTVAHNKLKDSSSPISDLPVEEFYSTRIVFDIEGNKRQVVDALDRIVVRYHYDMLRNRIHQASMEAGERWMLNDVSGNLLYAWDSRDHRFRTTYDAVRRPTDVFLREGGNTERIVERSTYGESLPDPEANNLRGKVVEIRDQAGIAVHDEYDFKGNPLRSLRQVAQSFKGTLDWSGPLPLEPEVHVSRTRYDALNRPIQWIAPHSQQAGTTINVIQRIYNDANLLEKVHVWLDRDVEPDGWLDPDTASLHAVTNIEYDAKGQRMLVDYGNGARTTYTYDPLTFRLARKVTRRNVAAFPDDCPASEPPGWPGCQVQNLHYTYDPAGNIMHIRDDAQQTVYLRNKRVEPSAEYTYDAIYRLIEATGREHLGQAGGIPNAPAPYSYNDASRAGLLQPNDGNAMGRYLERYAYDAVGNCLELRHHGTDPTHSGWTRTYTYNETSQLEPGRQSNRLTSTTIGAANVAYSAGGDGFDAHGNMLRMPQLRVIQWDYKDQLRMTQRQAVSEADSDGLQRNGERTWYVYDSTGQRVRKVTERATGQIKDERIYLDGFEVYRKNGATSLVRETLHIMDEEHRIARVERRIQGQESNMPAQLVRYELSNHLGSVTLELDDQARIVSYEEYTPFGSTSFQGVRSETVTPKRYRYTGAERDEESGLYYQRARYYAPWLARWTSADPLGLKDGVNVFAYVRNSPVGLVDPQGTASKKPELPEWQQAINEENEQRENRGELLDRNAVLADMYRRSDAAATAKTKSKRGRSPDKQPKPAASEQPNDTPEGTAGEEVSTPESREAEFQEVLRREAARREAMQREPVGAPAPQGLALFADAIGRTSLDASGSVIEAQLTAYEFVLTSIYGGLAFRALGWGLRGLGLTRLISAAGSRAASSPSVQSAREMLGRVSGRVSRWLGRSPAPNSGAANAAAHEAYKAQLRAQMPKPNVRDPRLRELVDYLYREGAQVGSGSTAAAIRAELATGQAVGGAWHAQKGRDAIVALERWLTRNPQAGRADISAAQNIIADLRNALGL